MRAFYFCIIIFGLFFAATVFAQEGGGEVICPPPPTCPETNTWDEYQCASACNADIQTRRVFEWHDLESIPGGDCPAYNCKYNKREGAWSKNSSCQPWQACEPGGIRRKSVYGPKNYNDTLPSCSCSAGQCIMAPENPRYYDNPDDSDQPDKSMEKENIKLPIKFDWDDVEGWKAEPDGPKSYLFNLNTAKGTVTKILDMSEYAGLRKDNDICFLESNTDYSWQASACCSADGQNCGAPSDWNFHTSPAPELVSPDDPDWAGPKGVGGIVITPEKPLTIDWCDVKEAKSYRFRVFLEDEKSKEKICSPLMHNPFITGDQCEPWLVKKERRDPEQIEKVLYSDFTDSDLTFFTKDTTYDWEVKICLDEHGGVEGECEDFGQRWSFTSEQKTFKELTLLYPPDDPEGKTPVGFPLVLDWSAPSGMNSFMYQINGISYTTQVSQSKALDFPDISVNRFYKWRVKACSDYRALECEEFSPERTFKTTGQPPVLENPASGASAAPIPVNLKWQGVPGANSYIVNITGNGLSLEKTVTEPELSLTYPEYGVRQETDYTWQVKTCAKGGFPCGPYSSPQNFKTFRLPVPSNPWPTDNGQFSTDGHSVSWDKIPQAKAYQYKIKYLALASDEKDQTCQALTGTEVVPLKTAPVESDFVQLKCLGQYQWQAQSCLDQNCAETSNWSGPWTFNLAEPSFLGKGGLIPCGKSVDDPKTPWNEREPCQISHIFLLVKVIIEFLLFRVIPLLLVLLTVYSALIFYFSIGRASALAKIIALWKSVGIGLGVVFLGWTVVSLFIRFVKMI